MNPFCIPTWVNGVIFQGASLLFDLGKKSDPGFLFLCDCCEVDRSYGKRFNGKNFGTKIRLIHKNVAFYRLIFLLALFCSFVYSSVSKMFEIEMIKEKSRNGCNTWRKMSKKYNLPIERNTIAKPLIWYCGANRCPFGWSLWQITG